MHYLIAFIIVLGIIYSIVYALGMLTNSLASLAAQYSINLVLAAIPAGIAYRKEKKWLLWFMYGLFLWPVALIHVILSEKDKYGFIGEKEQFHHVPAPMEQTPIYEEGLTTCDSIDKSRTLDELIEELNGLTGLENVKRHLGKLFSQIRADEEKKRRGLPVMNSRSLHMVFTGNPGTGKTTVARLIAGIYKQMGIVRTGNFVEADRSSLVGQYIGQTAVLTTKKIEEALGGVLFIDEAYTLYHEDDPRDFGHEAIETILKAMEDKRDDLVVIVAGYTDEMNRFLESNPGLRSRFTNYIEFEDYTAEELMNIFVSLCKENSLILSGDAANVMQHFFAQTCNNKPKEFGNARTVRNVFQEVCYSQSNRISGYADIEALSDEQLMTITADDVQVLFANSSM
ncbi:MAG: AAA family ATPase [Schwartzia sp.]|nr:AAA family ATPase [Schwartzia sp. (in: firmicutes)]